MKVLRALALAAATTMLGVGLVACAEAREPERPQIVVTTNILGDVVENLAGDAAAVTTLMKPNADPHSFEVSAQEAALMDSADLLVTNGLGLEEGLQKHIDRATSAGVPAVVAGDVITTLPYASGDAEGPDDPHFWTDPARMVQVVNAAEAALVEVDGIDTTQVHENADAYRAQLAALDTEMVETFAQIPSERRALVTNHHVFGYLTERFDFRVIGAVIPGGTTLAAPSAADLRDLTNAIDKAGVRTIFAESSQSDRLIQVLASEAGVHVNVVELYTESLTEPGGGADTYLLMMRTNTQRIADGLTP
ncbi:zinc ABC transporter substrate-binding protein AztC [Leucobacter sp. gxy201]|uniref:zinc ABC transporter substrate-binding protein AztC n=1 Tax=Leucobacter sp. gxy201 TaxID=2957200 RepID=UPI003D9FE65A